MMKFFKNIKPASLLYGASLVLAVLVGYQVAFTQQPQPTPPQTPGGNQGNSPLAGIQVVLPGTSTPPCNSPTGCNVSAPLTTGTEAQTIGDGQTVKNIIGAINFNNGLLKITPASQTQSCYTQVNGGPGIDLIHPGPCTAQDTTQLLLQKINTDPAFILTKQAFRSALGLALSSGSPSPTLTANTAIGASSAILSVSDLYVTSINAYLSDILSKKLTIQDIYPNLAGTRHTEKDCTSTGTISGARMGLVYKDLTDGTFCNFVGASCPIGWKVASPTGGAFWHSAAATGSYYVDPTVVDLGAGSGGSQCQSSQTAKTCSTPSVSCLIPGHPFSKTVNSLTCSGTNKTYHSYYSTGDHCMGAMINSSCKGATATTVSGGVLEIGCY